MDMRERIEKSVSRYFFLKGKRPEKIMLAADTFEALKNECLDAYDNAADDLTGERIHTFMGIKIFSINSNDVICLP